MFDWVDYEAPCSRCNAPLTKRDFQSKDGECHLDVIQPSAVSRFYAICRGCNAWNEFKVIPLSEASIVRDEDAEAKQRTVLDA